MVGACERISGATIFFDTDTFSARATMVQRCRFNFMREAQIWTARSILISEYCTRSSRTSSCSVTSFTKN